MNMFRDKAGMMPLMKAGLMAMAKSGKSDPAVVARVTRLIRVSRNCPGRSSFPPTASTASRSRCGEPGFAARRGEALRWRISEGERPDAASGPRSWLPVPHRVAGRAAAGSIPRGLEGHRADLGRRRQRDPGELPAPGRSGRTLHGALPYSGTRRFRDDGAVHRRVAFKSCCNNSCSHGRRHHAAARPHRRGPANRAGDRLRLPTFRPISSGGAHPTREPGNPPGPVRPTYRRSSKIRPSASSRAISNACSAISRENPARASNPISFIRTARSAPSFVRYGPIRRLRASTSAAASSVSASLAEAVRATSARHALGDQARLHRAVGLPTTNQASRPVLRERRVADRPRFHKPADHRFDRLARRLDDRRGDLGIDLRARPALHLPCQHAAQASLGRRIPGEVGQCRLIKPVRVGGRGTTGARHAPTMPSLTADARCFICEV